MSGDLCNDHKHTYDTSIHKKKTKVIVFSNSESPLRVYVLRVTEL